MAILDRGGSNSAPLPAILLRGCSGGQGAGPGWVVTFFKGRRGGWGRSLGPTLSRRAGTPSPARRRCTLNASDLCTGSAFVPSAPDAESLGKPQPPGVPAQVDHLAPCAVCGHRVLSSGALGRMRRPEWRSWDPFLFILESNFAVVRDPLFSKARVCSFGFGFSFDVDQFFAVWFLFQDSV